jgi:hypothetical protein
MAQLAPSHFEPIIKLVATTNVHESCQVSDAADESVNDSDWADRNTNLENALSVSSESSASVNNASILLSTGS